MPARDACVRPFKFASRLPLILRGAFFLAGEKIDQTTVNKKPGMHTMNRRATLLADTGRHALERAGPRRTVVCVSDPINVPGPQLLPFVPVELIPVLGIDRTLNDMKGRSPGVPLGSPSCGLLDNPQ